MIRCMHTTSHLSEELLNSWVDGVVTGSERSVICVHLGHCQRCRHEVEALGAVKQLLSDLPAPPLPRSFQITPDQILSSGTGTNPMARASQNRNPVAVSARHGGIVNSNGPVLRKADSALEFTFAATALAVAILAGIRVVSNRRARRDRLSSIRLKE